MAPETDNRTRALEDWAEIHQLLGADHISVQYMSVKNGVRYVSGRHHDDRLRRADGGWKLHERKIAFYHHAPLAEGFAGKPTFITNDGTPPVPQPA